MWDRIKDMLRRGKRELDKGKNDRAMYIIAGLGNPTREYKRTRHDTEFEIIDVLADILGTTAGEKKFEGLYDKEIIGGEKILLLKPRIFMNLGDESMKTTANFYKVDHEHIIIIYDDISLNVGQLRVRRKGSAGGYNGIKNIIAHLGTQEFSWIRVEAGDKPKKMDLVDYVLSRSSKGDRVFMEDAFKDASKAVDVIITESMDTVMNQFNSHKA